MGGNFDRRKRIVRPSPLTPDPAIRAFDLSQDFDPFAAFSDTTNMTDEEVVSAFEKYKAGNEMPAMKRLQTRLDLTAKEFSGEQLVSEKAKEIRAALMQERLRLSSPDITIDDATRLKPPPEVRAARGVPPDIVKLGWHNIGWWQDLKDEHRPLYYKPDIRGIFQPEPSQVRDDYLFKQVETPTKYTVGSMVTPSYPINPKSVKGKDVAGKVTNVVGKASAAFDPVGEVASQVLPRAASAAGLGAEVAMGAAMIPLAVGAFTQQAGDPMGDFIAGFAPGEFEKWQERQEESRKKQNAAAIQSIINRPYDPNQSSPRRRQG